MPAQKKEARRTGVLRERAKYSTLSPRSTYFTTLNTPARGCIHLDELFLRFVEHVDIICRNDTNINPKLNPNHGK